MYISFIVIGDYSLITYSFHKIECADLFGAFSITIHDWTTVLYAIHEDTQFESRLKSLLLIGINLLFMIISVVNFSYCRKLWCLHQLSSLHRCAIYSDIFSSHSRHSDVACRIEIIVAYQRSFWCSGKRLYYRYYALGRIIISFYLRILPVAFLRGMHLHRKKMTTNSRLRYFG